PGSRGGADRARPPLYNCCPLGDKQRTARSIIKVESRTDDGTAITGKIRPAVAIDIILFLVMRSAEQRVAPSIFHRFGKPEHRVGSPASRLIQQQFTFGLLWPARS